MNDEGVDMGSITGVCANVQMCLYILPGLNSLSQLVHACFLANVHRRKALINWRLPRERERERENEKEETGREGEAWERKNENEAGLARFPACKLTWSSICSVASVTKSGHVVHTNKRTEMH